VHIEVVTLFPDMVRGAVGFGILGRAAERGLLRVGTEDPRAHALNAHRTVDDRPYGGGPGMVLKPEPMLCAIRAAHARLPAGSPRICLSAQGELFSAAKARELAALPGFLLIAGRYEGIDERVMALGVDRSSAEDSFAAGLLDWPHYTRPEVFEGLAVPQVLLSGDHADIRRWRLEQAVGRTWLRRPDLIVKEGLSAEAVQLLDEFLAARRAGEPAEGR